MYVYTNVKGELRKKKWKYYAGNADGRPCDRDETNTKGKVGNIRRIYLVRHGQKKRGISTLVIRLSYHGPYFLREATPSGQRACINIYDNTVSFHFVAKIGPYVNAHTTPCFRPSANSGRHATPCQRHQGVPRRKGSEPSRSREGGPLAPPPPAPAGTLEAARTRQAVACSECAPFVV